MDKYLRSNENTQANDNHFYYNTFDPNIYLYLNPEIEIRSNISSVENAFDHYLTYGIQNNLLTNKYDYVNFPDNFDYKVYYAFYQSNILNDLFLDDDIKIGISNDPERIATLHFIKRRGQQDNYFTKYSIDSNFNPYLYRTMHNITEPMSDAELYFHYQSNLLYSDSPVTIGNLEELTYYMKHKNVTIQFENMKVENDHVIKNNLFVYNNAYIAGKLGVCDGDLVVDGGTIEVNSTFQSEDKILDFPGSIYLSNHRFYISNIEIDVDSNMMTINIEYLKTSNLIVESIDTENFTTENLNVTNFVVSHLIPNINDSNNLGQSDLRWDSLYLSSNALFIGNVDIFSDDDSLYINTQNIKSSNLILENSLYTSNIFTSNINVNSFVITNLLPDRTNNTSLGSLDKRWDSLYLSSNALFIGGMSIDVDDDTMYIDSENIYTSNIVLENTLSCASNYTKYLKVEDYVLHHLIPQNNSKDLGSENNPWKNLYLPTASGIIHFGLKNENYKITREDKTIKITSCNVDTSNINVQQTLNTSNINVRHFVTSHLVPVEHDIYSLGTADLRWDSLYLSGNALYMSNMNIEVTDEVMYIHGETIHTSNIILNNRLSTSNIITSNIEVKSFVKSHLIPETHNMYNLGTTDLRWDTLYLSSNALHIDNMSIEVKDEVMYIHGETVHTSNLILNDTLYTSNIITSNIEVKSFVKSHLIPNIHNIYNLGTTDLRWDSLYLSGNALYMSNMNIEVKDEVMYIHGETVHTSNLILNDTLSTSNIITSNIITSNIEVNSFVQSHLVPENTDIYNLGRDDLRWNSLYLSSNALHIGTMNIHVEDDTMYLDGYNLRTSNFYTSNVYTSNIYTENSISTDIYNSNILTTNITSKLIQSCNIIPYLNSNSDLGEHLNKWNNLYTYNMFGTHYVDSDERDYNETECNIININSYISTSLQPNPTYADYIKRIPIYKYKKKWDLEDTFERNSNNITSSNIGIRAVDLDNIIHNAITKRTSYIPNIKKYVTVSGTTDVFVFKLSLIDTTWYEIFQNVNVIDTLKKQILLINPDDGNRYQVYIAEAIPLVSSSGQDINVYSSNVLPDTVNNYIVYGTLTNDYKSINYHEILNYLIIACQEKFT